MGDRTNFINQRLIRPHSVEARVMQEPAGTGYNSHQSSGFHPLVSLHLKLGLLIWRGNVLTLMCNINLPLSWRPQNKQNPGRQLNTKWLLSYPVWKQRKTRKIISFSCRNSIFLLQSGSSTLPFHLPELSSMSLTQRLDKAELPHASKTTRSGDELDSQLPAYPPTVLCFYLCDLGCLHSFSFSCYLCVLRLSLSFSFTLLCPFRSLPKPFLLVIWIIHSRIVWAPKGRGTGKERERRKANKVLQGIS